MKMYMLKIAIIAASSFNLLGLASGPKYSDWSTPQNLGAVVNSTFNDAGPTISKDNLSLYLSSDRPGGSGGFDIWVSRRPDVGSPWGSPVNLGATINTDAIEGAPALSRDQHRIFFNSNRSGGFGGNDIWVSYREQIHDDFGWQTPVNLGPDVNTVFDEQGASYFENDDGGTPLLFFNSTRPGGTGTADIYLSPLGPDGSFGAPSEVVQLNTLAGDVRPSVSFDGLEIVFFSNRPSPIAGGTDLWMSTRESLFDVWETPVNLGPGINSTSSDQQPHLAPDRVTLYFTSNRPGGIGLQDLYLATRTKH
jgi:WD40-like Beta Propeller Repeat